jgi:FAD:protein FMN transferase
MLTFSSTALGTKWWITVRDDLTESKWNSLIAEIKSEIFQFNNLYSRFLEESLIGRLNKNKVLTEFNQEFLDIILYSLKLKEITCGYFDICIGKHLIEIGYDTHFAQALDKFEPILTTPNHDADTELKRIGEYQKPKLTPDSKLKASDLRAISQVTENNELGDKNFLLISDSKIIISDDTLIDFGGLGKGWLIDKIGKLLRLNEIENFSINGGGDIFSTGHRFYLEHPINPDECIGFIDIKNQALACSSYNRRQFSLKDNHLIDPIKNESSKNYLAVFTQASTALEADIAATTICVCPAELLPSLRERLQIEYLLILPDETYIKSPKYNGQLFN